MTTLAAPKSWIESVCLLKLPSRADQRLSDLMDRNNEGQLDADDRAELESLVEISESLSLVRAEALHLLGRTPE